MLSSIGEFDIVLSGEEAKQLKDNYIKLEQESTILKNNLSKKEE